VKALGYNKPLYILPFDQRGSVETKIFGRYEDLNTARTSEIAAAKQVIYDGLKRAIAQGASKEKSAILVDEQFGAAILRDAQVNGITTAYPVEKSGQEEFDFEYGDDFAAHIEKFKPAFCKVLVRYNPEGDTAMNLRQAERLRRLSFYLRRESQSRFMLELLVPAEKAHLAKFKGDTKAYDLNLRPQLMVEAIQELQSGGVEPDIWKVEGLDRRADGEAVVAAARRERREEVGCIVLGAGENDQKVRERLKLAGEIKGFIGFALGRTDFWEALANLRARQFTRGMAVDEISKRYLEFVQIFKLSSERKIKPTYENEIKNATWNGGPGSYGREHGAAPNKGRASVRSL
jgi:myo-inositol catabolism protein IolC